MTQIRFAPEVPDELAEAVLWYEARKKLGGLDNHRQEPWKVPLPVFIEELYWKRFARARPESVVSIEEHARQQEKKKAEKREVEVTVEGFRMSVADIFCE